MIRDTHPITICPRFLEMASKPGAERYILMVLMPFAQEARLRITTDCCTQSSQGNKGEIHSKLIDSYKDIIEREQSQPLMFWIEQVINAFDINCLPVIDADQLEFRDLRELALLVCTNTPYVRDLITDNILNYRKYEDHIKKHSINALDKESAVEKIKIVKSGKIEVQVNIADVIAQKGGMVAKDKSKIIKKVSGK